MLQSPFYPRNNSYSTATLADVCGVSGVSPDGECNLFQPGVQTGVQPAVHPVPGGRGRLQAPTGTTSRRTSASRGRWAASGGFLALDSRRRGGRQRRARRLLALPTTVRACRTSPAPSTTTLGSQLTTNRNHTLGNLGTPGTVLLRQSRDRSVRRAFPADAHLSADGTRSTGDIHIFDANLQVPYAQTWTAGWQRKLTQNMAIEARYVGTRALQDVARLQLQRDQHRREQLPERVPARAAEPAGELAAGRGATFRYFGPTPARLRCRSSSRISAGLPASAAGELGQLLVGAVREQHVREPAGDASIRSRSARPMRWTRMRRAVNNALNAGLPANFLVVNPDLLGGAEVTGNGGGTNYNSHAARTAQAALARPAVRGQLRLRQCVSVRTSTRSAGRMAKRRDAAARVAWRTRSRRTGSTSCRSVAAAGSCSGVERGLIG